MRPLAALALVPALFLFAACEEEPLSEESNATGLSKTLTLRFESKSGALSLKSSGKKLTCDAPFEGLEGDRVDCARSGEKVQVIVKRGDDSVVVVRDMGGKRGYYTCTRKGEVTGLPAEMKCAITTIKPRGTGGLSSPFDSSVDGVTVPNTHWVDEEQTILRGMQPRSPGQFAELEAAGIERVVIFKNMTGSDTAQTEIDGFGLPAGAVIHVPFHWKDLPDFQTPCEETLEALRFVRDAAEDEKKVFFHCTVGEDRTGYLAALHGVLFEGADAASAFDLDMCEHGYGRGNPQKPAFVIGKLEDSLTPLYRSMAFLIQEGKLTAELEESACATEPDVPDEFLDDLACGTSTTLVP
jgi:hypothetical protein